MDNSTYASPAVVNGVVYEGSLGNNMTAFNATTGAILWQYDSGDDIHASPAVANGKVYFTNYLQAYALNANDGTVSWISDIGGAGPLKSAVVNGNVYVGSDDGKIYAFRESDGEYGRRVHSPLPRVV